MTDIHLYLGNNAVEHLVEYCAAQHLARFLLVADKNTYAVLGQAVEAAIKERGWDIKSVVFDEQEVIPNEDFIFQVLLQADFSERMYIAVGSGTLTDITRFASHRSRRPFISLPTAPSVDGFTSPSASLVVRNIKKTVISQPPVAVISDLPTLARAPQPMIAAGFGDILGKAIALADWRLGHLVWDEPYSAEIAQRVRQTLDTCVSAVAEIGQATPSGIEKLMYSLIDSGMCMLDFGNSRPAAGAEHYMSHFLEMKLLREGRPAVLHGAKVGQCSVLVAGLYDRLRQISRAEAEARLQASSLPDREDEVACIERVFGPIAGSLVIEQAPFLEMSPQAYAQLKERILLHWEEIQSLARLVPPAHEMSRLLVQAGGPAQPADLNLTAEEISQSLEYAHFIRNRFTVRKLGRILGF
ncbi:MAG: sn-glycerol-1-phosphate dehydrogenase [Anaerolineaceae bacterium]|nr:sn-glycerol-1-phosphate dehydrogenase [Anaerolineaceae bacterium]